MRARRQWLIAGMLGAALAVAGCGAGTTTVAAQLSPKQELLAAIHQLGAASAVTTTTQLSDPAALTALGADAGRWTALASSVLTIEARSANGAGLSAGTGVPDASVVLDNRGTKLFEARLVAGTLYLRADVARLAALVPGASADASRFLGRLPRTSAWVRALTAGQWVSVPSLVLNAALGHLGAGAVTPAQAFSELTTAVQGHSTVTRAGDGHLVVTVHPAAWHSAGARHRDHPVATRFDVYLTGGQITRIVTDVPTRTAATLPVDVAVSEAGAAISAPPGAAPVNLTDLAPLARMFSSAPGHAA